MLQLYEYRRKYGVRKEKLEIFSKTVSLHDDELYTMETYTSECVSHWRIMSYADCLLGDDGRATIKMSFAYTPGGNDE